MTRFHWSRYGWIAIVAVLLMNACDRSQSSSAPPTSDLSPQPSVSAPESPVAVLPSDDGTQSDPTSPVAAPKPVAACRHLETQAEMTDCAAKSAQDADTQLNQVYQQLRDQLNDSPQDALLVDAQLAWIEFRDQDCAFDRSRFTGGSIEPMIYSNCVERVTKQRTRDLEQYLRETRDGP